MSLLVHEHRMSTHGLISLTFSPKGCNFHQTNIHFLQGLYQNLSLVCVHVNTGNLGCAHVCTWVNVGVMCVWRPGIYSKCLIQLLNTQFLRQELSSKKLTMLYFMSNNTFQITFKQRRKGRYLILYYYCIIRLFCLYVCLAVTCLQR